MIWYVTAKPLFCETANLNQFIFVAGQTVQRFTSNHHHHHH